MKKPSIEAAPRIELVRGDITAERVDAVVNAANEALLGGGGVDGAIHRAAGPELLAECRTIGGCPTGEARITGGYRLSAKHVIHTVGPVWRGGASNEALLLASCYENSLRLAVDAGCRSIAFPAISCGVYRFPVARAAEVSIQVVHAWTEKHADPKLIRWVLFDETAFQAWVATAERILPPGIWSGLGA